MKMKYPRTYHAPWSLGATDDDKTHKNLEAFETKIVLITEKMDGENTTMMRDCIYARSLDSKHHPSRSAVKQIWSSIAYKIPSNFRICGENLYAKHSIKYENLEDYFMVFSIWDGDTCLSWEDTVHMCSVLGLTTVRELFSGEFDEKICREAFDTAVSNGAEGVVVRNVNSFKYEHFKYNCFKSVRENHVTTNEHWMHSKIEVNKLRA